MLAQMLSEQLKVQHFVVAVSHPMKTLTKLLFRSHACVYAGHPITDIRKKDPIESRRLMDRINREFLEPLSTNDSIVTFIPDTIEEDLILDSTDSETLRQRLWPRAWDSGEPPITEDPSSVKELPHFSELAKIVSTSKPMYEAAIFGQMSDRDYRLVNQVRNFLFTLLKEVPSSTGVEAEFFQAKYSGKEHSIYFFNPDKISRGRPGSGAPRWATNVTGEYNDIETLAKEVTSTVEQPYIRLQ